MKSLILFSLLTALALLPACSAEDTDSGEKGTGADTDTGTSADSDVDTDTDGDVDSDTGTVCDEQEFQIRHVPIRLMILQDRSDSLYLEDHWDQAVNAIQGLLETFDGDGIEFGLDCFPDSAAGQCSTWAPVVLDSGPDQQAQIADELDSIDPGGATPLFCALDNFNEPDYAPVFTGNDLEHYLVLVSDGEDTCSNNCEGSDGAPVSIDLLADTTDQLAGNGTKVIVIGFTVSLGEEQLTAIAQNGGTEFDDYLLAGDEAELEEALNSIAYLVYSCVFEVEEPDASADPDLVNFYFDGEPVPYVEDCAEEDGWTWHDEEHTLVEFCGAACEQIKSGEVESITATFGCETIAE